jgi:hypothetical protein
MTTPSPYPSPPRGEGIEFWSLKFRLLFGAWCLEFGAYIFTPASPIALIYSFFSTSFGIP